MNAPDPERMVAIRADALEVLASGTQATMAHVENCAAGLRQPTWEERLGITAALRLAQEAQDAPQGPGVQNPVAVDPAALEAVLGWVALSLDPHAAGPTVRQTAALAGPVRALYAALRR